MAYSDDLVGRYVTLKAVTPDDAEFILSIRNDEQFKGKIPKLNCSIEEQRQWIIKQRKMPEDYYYIIWSKDGKRLGTLGAYCAENGEYETGRIVSYGDPRENMEAYLLMLDFVFSKRDYVTGWCFAENKKIVTLNSKLGTIITEIITNENGDKIFCNVTRKEDYLRCSKKIKKLLGWHN